MLRRAAGRDDCEAELDQFLDRRHDMVLVVVLYRDERRPSLRQRHSRSDQRLGEGDVEIMSDSHDFTGALHFWSKHGIGPGEAREREHRFFHGDIVDPAPDLAQRGQRLARHHPGGDLGDRPADRLGDKRHRAAGARIDLDQIDLALLDRELDVHQSLDLERQRQLARLAVDLVDDILGKAVRRDRARAVARVHASFLDVLEHAADNDIAAVANGVDLEPHQRVRRVWAQPAPSPAHALCPGGARSASRHRSLERLEMRPNLHAEIRAGQF